ncbi:MAG TPA: galactokinase [Vicinamibacterales bacterium]|jgi:galactokinase
MTFEQLFGEAPELRVSAPGRVNLIGEHTDYNGGFVLPTVIPQRTTVEIARRSDRTVRVWSANVGARSPFQYTLGSEQRRGAWADYVQGITWVLGDAGFEIGGIDVRIESTVPLGSGLSSSAALEVAMLRALRDTFALTFDDVRLALLGQRAENEFVGAPVGVMDQMACTLASDGQALFLDTRSLDWSVVPLPPDAELIVLNSGVAHNHAKGDYRTRRAECEEAARRLGVKQLRDLDVKDVPRVMELPDPLGRRARHVVTEDDRVLAAVRVMRSGDLAELGRLFYASHDSMRDDYEVSIPEIDLLVDLARAEPDVYGARLTGGGFGGSVVMLARPGHAVDVAARIASHYAEKTRQRPTVLVPA